LQPSRSFRASAHARGATTHAFEFSALRGYFLSIPGSAALAKATWQPYPWRLPPLPPRLFFPRCCHRWDYGQLKLYVENNLKLLQPDDNHEAATMRSYFKVRYS
jgi:hypothetical protein